MERSFARIAVIQLLALAALLEFAHAQGVIIPAAGPINRSMGGASVAAPIDAMGAIYWNPASISGMERSELGFGVDLLWANHSVDSTFGPFSGSTNGNAGVVAIPNIGFVHHVEDTSISLGFGVNTSAGFKTNLPADPTNPVLSPVPWGLGQCQLERSVYSNCSGTRGCRQRPSLPGGFTYDHNSPAYP